MVLFLLLLAMHSFSLVASIIESDRIAIVRDHWQPGAVIIFDLDNTLVHPAGRIGSDEWFVALIAEKQQQGKTFYEALQAAIAVYSEVQYGIALQPIEPTSATFLKLLQQEGVLVMALTARSLPMINRTIDQLAAIDIDFSHNHIGNPVVLRELVHPYVYKRGILFSGQNNKGDALFDFLTYCGIMPTKIIFVDDKLSNLHAVMQAADKHDVPFVGIRYTALDEYVAALNMQEAHEELIAFYHR